MVMVVEKDLRKVLGVKSLEQVLERMQTADLSVEERRSLEEFYGIGCRARSNTESARAEGLKTSSVCARRLRALRKMGAQSLVFRKGGRLSVGMWGDK